MQLRYKYLFSLLLLINITVWIAVLTFPDKNLQLIACDVGQGDAVLAVYGKTQILVDGGPDSSVLDCLSDHLPFFDRKIEVIVLSHPQKDHFGGLIDVVKRYDVDVIVATPLDSVSQEYRVLKDEVGGRGIRVINPSKGQRLRVGLIYLDILNPSKKFLTENLVENKSKLTNQQVNKFSNVLGAYTSKKDPNNFSVVVILSFKDFEALLTGDIGPEISDDIINTGLIKDVEYLKVPHHGSKNGLTKELLDASTPEIAVISVGAKNSYGHPHQEVIKVLSDKGIKILRTDIQGDIVVETNGQNLLIKTK